MHDSEQRPVISEADITSRGIERRTFLGRFGMAVALLGVAGIMPACGGGEAASDDAAADADAAEASDSDAMEGSTPDSAAASTPDSASDASDSDAGSATSDSDAG